MRPVLLLIPVLVAMAFGWTAPVAQAQPVRAETETRRAELLDTLHRAEIPVILQFQHVGDLGFVMTNISRLGPGNVMGALIAAIMLCIRPQLALRLAVLMVLGLWLRELIAQALQSPRPFWIDPEVKTFSDKASLPTTCGLPSGHALVGTAIWMFLAAEVRRDWAWSVAAFIAAAICVSRIYLGVHFPSDVTLGFILGFAYAAAFRRVEWFAAVTWFQWGRVGRVGAALLVGLGMIAVGWVVREVFASGPLPEAWRGYGGATRGIGIHAMLGGAIFGMGAALAFLGAWAGAGGSWWWRLLRLALIGGAYFGARWLKAHYWTGKFHFGTGLLKPWTEGPEWMQLAYWFCWNAMRAFLGWFFVQWLLIRTGLSQRQPLVLETADPGFAKVPSAKNSLGSRNPP